MKKILCLLAFMAGATIAQAQIATSGGEVYVEEGGTVAYNNPAIFVYPTYDPIGEIYRCKILFFGTGATTDAKGDFYLNVSKADVDAKTGAGTGETAQMHNAVLQVVVDYFEAITENSGISFTI